MSTLTTPRPLAATSSRPHPGPRIAPPQPTSSVPWAALLDGPFEADRCNWVMAAEGVLLPVPAGDATPAPRRRRFGRR
jgi:hypothetical protein